MRGFRGFATGVLTLVALQVLGSGKGPEQGGKLIAWAGTGVRALMSPDVPGIPRAAKAPPAKPSKDSRDSSSGTGGVGGTLPRNPTIDA